MGRIYLERLKKAPVTASVLIVCLIVFALIHLTFPDYSLVDKAIFYGCFYKPFIFIGQYWRLLTVGFTHISIYHISMNLVSLFNVGPIIEREFGKRNYIIILFGSIIMGSLFQLCSSSNSVSVGLSGGLYGLMGAYIYLVIQAGGLKIPQFRNMIMQLVFINLMINFMPNIGVRAHIGGLVAGILLTTILNKSSNKSLKTNGLLSLVILTGVIIFYLTKNHTISSDQAYLGTDLKILEMYSKLGLNIDTNSFIMRLKNIYK